MAADDLQRDAERAARLLDVVTENFAQELAQVLKLARSRLRGLMRRLETTRGGRLVATRTNLALTLQLRADLQRVLREAGFADLAFSASDAPMDRVAQAVMRSAEGQRVAQMAAFDLDVIAALKQLRFVELLQVGDDVAVTLWRTVLDGVLGLRLVSDLVQDLADVLDISEAHARTVYDTAVSTFSRQVEQMHATGQDDELFFYVGPVDRKVRRFCWERVGKVYTRDEIDGMDNGQLPNAMLTCGGYNCRHQFRKVSALDAELIALAGTGQRHEAVEKRMRDVEDRPRGVAA